MSGSAPRRRRRRLVIALAILACLLIVALLVLPRWLQPERHRDHIEALLEESTGWSAQLGEIELGLLGGLALRVAPVTLVAPNDTSRIEIQELEMHARWLPLLRGRLEVTRVSLERPEVRVVRESVEGGWILPGTGAGAAERSGTVHGEPDGDAEEGAREESGAGRDESGTRAVDDVTTSPESAATAGKGGWLDIGRVEIRDGTVLIDDRSGAAPLVFGLERLDARLQPSDLSFSADAEVNDSRGAVRAEGRWGGTMQLELDQIATSLLSELTDAAMIHPHGSVSGTITTQPGGVFDGRLEFDELTLLAGERPLAAATASFRITGRGDRWALDQLDVELDGVRLSGSGALAPGLALDLKAAEQPLRPLLALTQAVLPLPLEIEGPGSWDAVLEFERPAEGTLRYGASGRFAAERLRAAEVLPEVSGLETSFVLDRDGALAVTIARGVVAEGPLAGRLTITPLVPPGELRFEGSVEQAALGGLALPLLGERARSLAGLTRLEASVAADLGKAEISPEALAGRVELHAERLALTGWDIEGALREAAREKLGRLGRLAGGGEKAAADGGGGGPPETGLLDRLDAVISLDRQPWSLDSLALAGDGIEASGTGTLDPAAGVVDLDLRAVLDAARSDRLVTRHPLLRSLLDGNRRLIVPLQVRGPFASPSIGIDLGKVDAGAGAKDKARDKAKKLLRGLFDKKK